MADAKRPILPRVDARDLTVFVGTVCLTVGAWAWLGWAALMLPGAVLVWSALPPRPPFFVSK